MKRHRTDRWEVFAIAGFILVGTGIALREPVLLLATTVPIGLLLYGRVVIATPSAITITRELSPASPQPGEHVTVTITVTNDSDSLIRDFRIVDALPEELGVVSGTPRAGLVIPAGDARSFSYDVAARRGAHEFGTPTVMCYSFSGSYVAELVPTVETTLVCEIPAEEVPLTDQTARKVGRVTSQAGAGGIEFHSTREYQPTDSITQIDWRRFAQSGELTTVEFREDRSVTMVVLVDQRASEEQRIAPGEPTLKELSLYAGERAFNALLQTGNRVGVGFLGGDMRALDIGAGSEHETRGTMLFDSDTAVAADGGARTRDAPPVTRYKRFITWLPDNAQVLVISSLLDDEPTELARALRAHRHDVSVLSPQVTTRQTIGQQLARRERALRINTLRSHGTVIEWDPADPLAVTLDRILDEVTHQ